MRTEVDTLNKWFAGDADAQDLFSRLVFIAHTWDDLVDKDKAISESDVNSLMFNALIHLPKNPFFRRYETEIRAFMYCSMISYTAANIMERSNNEQKIEIAHYMRYAVAQVGVFIIGVLHGTERAPTIVAEAMTTMIPERLAGYMAEHHKGVL